MVLAEVDHRWFAAPPPRASAERAAQDDQLCQPPHKISIRAREALARLSALPGRAGRQQRARHLRESLAFANVSYKIAANRNGFWE